MLIVRGISVSNTYDLYQKSTRLFETHNDMIQKWRVVKVSLMWT